MLTDPAKSANREDPDELGQKNCPILTLVGAMQLREFIGLMGCRSVAARRYHWLAGSIH